MHTDALLAATKGDKMRKLKATTAPPHAQWFWSLPPGTSFLDVVKTIRADDRFHSLFNEIALDHPNKPITAMQTYMDVRGVKGQ